MHQINIDGKFLSIYHRDIKPGNIIYSEKRWKFTDFGIACISDKN